MTKVLVFDSKLTVLYKDQLTTGSENFFKVEYEFNDETWKDYKKHAVFFQVVTQPKLEMEMPDTNIVEIPNELLIADLPLFIGVYGVHKTDGTILSTNFKAVPVEYGAFSGDIQSFENVAAAIVRSVDTKIKFIRLNEEGEFQYSTDGETWHKVTETIDYQSIFDKLDELDKNKQDKLPQDLNAQITIKESNIDGVAIKVEKKYIGLEKTCIIPFSKINFSVKDKNNGMYKLKVTQSSHNLINSYLSRVVINKVIDNKGIILQSGQSNINVYDVINDNGDLNIYINVPLEEYSVYNGKLILKGE